MIEFTVYMVLVVEVTVEVCDTITAMTITVRTGVAG